MWSVLAAINQRVVRSDLSLGDQVESIDIKHFISEAFVTQFDKRVLIGFVQQLDASRLSPIGEVGRSHHFRPTVHSDGLPHTCPHEIQCPNAIDLQCRHQGLTLRCDDPLLGLTLKIELYGMDAGTRNPAHPDSTGQTNPERLHRRPQRELVRITYPDSRGHLLMASGLQRSASSRNNWSHASDCIYSQEPQPKPNNIQCRIS